MSITAEEKARLMKEFATKEGDNCSPEVQVAILSSRNATLTEHFKTHAKDNHSRRGLLMMVAQRRKLLDYLKKNDEGRYQTLIQRLASAAKPFRLTQCNARAERCGRFSFRAGLQARSIPVELPIQFTKKCREI